MGTLRVDVRGIAELRRGLSLLVPLDARNELRDGLKAAASIVASEAKTRVPVGSGKARDSIRPTVSGHRAYVMGGKASVPYYGWLDFGSRTPVKGNPRSVGPWVGSGSGPSRGRFIYPAFDAKAHQVVAAVEEAVFHALRRAGF